MNKIVLKYHRPFWIIIFFVCLSGCMSSYIKEELLTRFSYSIRSSGAMPMGEESGFVKSRFCSKKTMQCISYVSAEPRDHNFKSTYIITSNSTEDTVTLDLIDREYAPKYFGTIILLHGFRMRKEAMESSSDYFRFLGFNVIAIDLPYHGESDGDTPGFGVGDVDIIGEFIDNLETKNSQQPLYLLGMSIGATTAINVASERNDLQGLILQAPVMKFDDATVEIVNLQYPWLSLLFSDNSVRLGANEAMAEAKIVIEQTDLAKILPAVKIPTLIFASTTDPVSDYSKIAAISKNKNIRVEAIKERSHFGMALLGDKQSIIIDDWLASIYSRNLNTEKHCKLPINTENKTLCLSQ